MLSKKQLDILRWPYTGKTALICDGAVRSGKTSVMSLSFVLWAMGQFDQCNFGLCGKTVASAERNIIQPLLGVTYFAQTGFALNYTRSDHVLTITRGEKLNRFYVFGGRDESSYMLIQGVTLAGVLLDEAALMPRSFVEQSLARCSVHGAKLWFNCNPDVPEHWFRKEWLLKLAEKDATHLHFVMDDNPGLSPETKARYESMYSGVFYRRYVLGEWTAGDGLIYDMFNPEVQCYEDGERPVALYNVAARYIACDYGTANPFVLLDIYDDGETVWVDNEYRWDSKDMDRCGRQKTDGEYGKDFLRFMGDDPQRFCPAVVDPSAASFIAELTRLQVYVMPGDNDVLDGIRRVAALLHQGRIRIHRRCEGLVNELGSYAWDSKAAAMGVEKPVKSMDHGPDALRYFVNTCLPSWRYGEEG